ncbi:MAG: hypothetical protein GY757_40125, partial [bacterium]|nr:hypothetical protein [bacterium]
MEITVSVEVEAHETPSGSICVPIKITGENLNYSTELNLSIPGYKKTKEGLDNLILTVISEMFYPSTGGEKKE